VYTRTRVELVTLDPGQVEGYHLQIVSERRWQECGGQFSVFHNPHAVLLGWAMLSRIKASVQDRQYSFPLQALFDFLRGAQLEIGRLSYNSLNETMRPFQSRSGGFLDPDG
jgi:hypothetical protein